MRYQLSDIDMGEAEAIAVAEVVRSKWLSLGPRTEAFEQRFAEQFGVRHAVTVSNCTAALHLALKACGVGSGDEVITPSYTFVATANAILYQGAVPVFVDIAGPHDLNVSVDEIEARITPRTAAIMVVHLAGYAAHMDRIMELAERHGLAVIEDACHAVGARYDAGGASRWSGHRLGTIGHAGCYSFFANKNMVTGEGGMLVTNDDRIAAIARRCRSHGMTKSSWDKASGRATDYDVVDLGYNYRATELTAAIGLVQLAKLERNNRRRGVLARRYHGALAGLAGVSLPFADRSDDSGHHILPILLDDPRRRAGFRQSLLAQGIQSSVHYPPAHLFSHYTRNYPQRQPLPVTEEIATREVTLPLHPLLADEDVDAICSAVERALYEAHATVEA